MIGRKVKTTNGPGKVSKASGKGWVVVETDDGGSYRMRLSQLWDYTVGSTEPAAAGPSLSLPTQRSGDPGMPKNWSCSLLKKRVMTTLGVGALKHV